MTIALHRLILPHWVCVKRIRRQAAGHVWSTKGSPTQPECMELYAMRLTFRVSLQKPDGEVATGSRAISDLAGERAAIESPNDLPPGTA